MILTDMREDGSNDFVSDLMQDTSSSEHDNSQHLKKGSCVNVKLPGEDEWKRLS